MKLFALLVLIPILSCSHSKIKPDSLSEHILQVSGTNRSYALFTPKIKPDEKEKVPLMLVLHGGTGNAQHSAQTMGMNTVAEKNNFIVAYPNGTGTLLGENRKVWNAGKCCAAASRNNIDDVKFIDEAIKDIIKNNPIDTKRIYITGESNGAMLTFRLVCELPNVFAAAIPMAGTLMVDQCPHGQDVALLEVHGTADKNVPYNGGKGEGYSQVDYRSVPETLKMITTPRQCDKPKETKLSNGDIQNEYHCKNGAPVQTLLVNGGQHAWPNFGSEKAWDFAKNFKRK